MIQDLSGSWCIKGTRESMTTVDSPVPLIHHDPDKFWITDPDLDHTKGRQFDQVAHKHNWLKSRKSVASRGCFERYANSNNHCRLSVKTRAEMSFANAGKVS